MKLREPIQARDDHGHILRRLAVETTRVTGGIQILQCKSPFGSVGECALLEAERSRHAAEGVRSRSEAIVENVLYRVGAQLAVMRVASPEASRVFHF